MHNPNARQTRGLWLGAAIPVLVLAAGASAQAADQTIPSLSEVVVTAQKRSERLQDVPLAVTALSANNLVESNKTSVEDFFRQVPGLSFSPQGNGMSNIAIRGVTTGANTNPTVAVTVDDVPVGSSSLLGYGSLLAPDLDPSDLQRIEVLRGPQGTLYGASSLGGLLKYVTVDPSTTGYAGRIQVDVNGVEKGDQGYGARGAVNVPLVADKLAVRIAAFGRRDAGFIDNITNGESDVNHNRVYGGRLSGLWQIADDVSLKVGALNNVTDKRAVLFSSVQNNALGLASPLNTLFVRPRTFGVSAARTF